MKDQIKLFRRVKCKAYLKEARDGVHIVLQKDGEPFYGKTVTGDNLVAYAVNSIGQHIADLSDFDGSGVEKVYRKRTEEQFNGCLVGYTYVDVKGKIGTDWESGLYSEYGYCYKYVTDRPKVGVVYFKNNSKRYVLPEDMEEVEDE